MFTFCVKGISCLFTSKVTPHRLTPDAIIEVNRMNFLLTNPPRLYCFDWNVNFWVNFTQIRVEYAHLILTEIYPKFTPTRSINSEWFWMCVFITREQLKNPLAQQVVEKVRPKPKGSVVLSCFSKHLLLRNSIPSGNENNHLVLLWLPRTKKTLFHFYLFRVV